MMFAIDSRAMARWSDEQLRERWVAFLMEAVRTGASCEEELPPTLRGIQGLFYREYERRGLQLALF